MSGKKDWLFRIQDMTDAINELQGHLVNISETDFLNDSFIQKATERYFEIIGEAARFVPKTIQEKYKSVPWADIIGMRHKISHDYLDVNPHTLWASYKDDLAPLKIQLIEIYKNEEKP